jgi:hypothetical protein
MPAKKADERPAVVPVRMLTTISGSRDGRAWPPYGEIAELPRDEALQLIAQGDAIPDNQAMPVENRILEPPGPPRPSRGVIGKKSMPKAAGGEAD